MGEVTINAVDGISFRVDEGEFAVVVGASGAGKTTVLNILGGMDSATDGEIILRGKDISRGNYLPEGLSERVLHVITPLPEAFRSAQALPLPN